MSSPRGSLVNPIGSFPHRNVLKCINLNLKYRGLMSKNNLTKILTIVLKKPICDKSLC